MNRVIVSFGIIYDGPSKLDILDNMLDKVFFVLSIDTTVFTKEFFFVKEEDSTDIVVETQDMRILRQKIEAVLADYKIEGLED